MLFDSITPCATLNHDPVSERKTMVAIIGVYGASCGDCAEPRRLKRK